MSDLEKQLKDAKARVQELEDVVQLKDRIWEDMDKELVLSEERRQALQSEVDQLKREKEDLLKEKESIPIDDKALLEKYKLQHEILESIQESLSCPICYEFFGKGNAVSLQCGHSFCDSCYKTWEKRHVEQFKSSPQQGPYLGPECPECRSADVKRGRVRIYALEEVVRIIERLVKSNQATNSTEAAPEAAHDAAPEATPEATQ